MQDSLPIIPKLQTSGREADVQNKPHGLHSLGTVDNSSLIGSLEPSQNPSSPTTAKGQACK